MAFSAPEHQSRARRISKKEAAHIKSRDFFKLAADMANPNIKLSFFDTLTSATKRPVQSFTPSSLLDPVHQKCLFNITLNNKTSNSILIASPNNKNLTIFHDTITSFNQQDNLSLNLEIQSTEYSINAIRLLSAHRLSHKSWQLSDGVSSHIKYFHAEFSAPTAKINILYWIKFDDENNGLEGNIINIDRGDYEKNNTTK